MGSYVDFIFSASIKKKGTYYIVIKLPSSPSTLHSSSSLSKLAPLADASIVTSASLQVLINATKKHPQTPGYIQLYETDVADSDRNVSWDPVRLDFSKLCGSRVNLDSQVLIEVYDYNRFSASTVIGLLHVTVREMISEDKSFFDLKKNDKDIGQLTIKSRVSESKLLSCEFTISGSDLVAKDLNGTSDPYFVIKTPIHIEDENTLGAINIKHVPDAEKRGVLKHKKTEGFREVYESPVIDKNLNPTWNPVRLSFYDLCKGSASVVLRIQCIDFNSVLSNEMIGEAKVSVRSLLESPESFAVPIHHKNKQTGTLNIQTRCFYL